MILVTPYSLDDILQGGGSPSLPDASKSGSHLEPGTVLVTNLPPVRRPGRPKQKRHQTRKHATDTNGELTMCLSHAERRKPTPYLLVGGHR